MTIKFIHLTTHSEYSMSSSIIRLDEMLQMSKEGGMPSVALTDHMNLFGAVKFFKKAISKGIKPIIGCELDLIYDPKDHDKFSLTVLCQNQQGYENLLEILSRAYQLDNMQKKPLVEKRWLLELSGGLIVLSGGYKGDVGKFILSDDDKKALQAVKEWKNCFGDRYYLEVSRFNRQREAELIRKLAIISDVTNVPLVATNHPLFINVDEYESHSTRVCISEGKLLSHYNKSPKYSKQQYFKSQQQMQELFADLPHSLENTINIAKRCNVILILDQISLPDFPLPNNYTVETYLTEVAESGLKKKFDDKCISNNDEAVDIEEVYYKRLSTELSVIISMGYAGYFLIVHDFIVWSKNNNIPVGPGRGSGAGSIVAYSLGITDIDPIKYELFFERFLNPERVSMPDFDIDFCINGRDKVINYVAAKYGQHTVAQIITFGTLSAKAVVRDVGRVFGQPYGLVDRVAKLIPMELGITLKKALTEPELKDKYDSDDVVKSIIDMAIKLEGIVRNAGKHAGGVVIAPGAIKKYSAVYRESIQDNLVTQYDKDDVEQVGLIKFDLLGLKTLTIIDNAVRIINKNLIDKLDISKIDLCDSKVYELICRCNTTAVFQLESRGMKDLIKRLQPDRFEDIIDLIALFRPGPLQSGMVDDFINRKHGREKVKYIHLSLEPVLSTTHGVILYQEQVMEIARRVGSYTLGKADLLRRAMGKKKLQEMAMQRNTFLTGAISNGLDERLANIIFDLMEKFSGYGFNKSHSTAYALLTYQTAWLKTNYTAEFMAAVMSSELENTDKLFGLINECRQMGIKVLSPSVNNSGYKFSIEENGIRFGLGAIKGIGQSVVDEIINKRNEGAFVNLFDFTNRVNLKKVSQKTMETLAYSGCLDSLNDSRGAIISKLPRYFGLSEQKQQDEQNGQVSLFDRGFDNNIANDVDESIGSEITTKEYLSGEMDTLGFYFSIHPMDLYKEDVKSLGILSIKSVYDNNNLPKKVVLAGIIIAIKRIVTKRGEPMFFVTIDDGNMMTDLLIFNDVYQESVDHVIKDRVIKIECAVSVDSNNVLRLRAVKIESLQHFREESCRTIEIKVSEEDYSSEKLSQLSDILAEQQQGGCSIFLSYDKNKFTGKFKLKENFRPAYDIVWNLRNIFGDNSILVRY